MQHNYWVFLHGRSIVVLVLKKKEGKKEKKRKEERCTGGCRAVEMMRARIKSLGGSCTLTWRCLWTLTSPRQLAQLGLTIIKAKKRLVCPGPLGLSWPGTDTITSSSTHTVMPLN
jgi:hypothetical protein